MIDIEAIKARAEAATKGPWQWWNLEEKDQGWGDQGPNLETVARGPIYFDGSQGADKDVITSWGHDANGINVEDHDAHFIAHTREDIPALIAEVERLRAIVADVIVARSNYPRIPECDRYTADDTITCGWKSAIESIDRTLDGTS